MYFRLRGTNQPLNKTGETDECGNPLADIEGQNNATKAFEDLWFYTNPIFVTNTNLTSVEKIIDNESVMIYPNPATDLLYIKGNNIQDITIFDITGKFINKYITDNDKISISSLNQGVYIIQIQTPEKIIRNKFQKK